MQFLEIDHIDLTEEQKAKALEILGVGNILLKKWSAFATKKEICGFRAAILRGESSGIPGDKLLEFQSDLPTMTAAKNVSQPLFGGRTIEVAVMQSFSAMAKKFAYDWSRGNNAEDYLQEAYLKVLDAMYSWLPDNGSDICTYIYHCLKHHMMKFVNNCNPFCPLSNADLQLLIQYKRIVKSDEHLTFDDIVQKMNLSLKKRLRLNQILSKVSCESQLGNDEEKFEPFQEESSENIIFTWEADEILNRSELTSLEREVLNASMQSYRGWQTEFARTHINPKTQQPYSRMRITQILESARAKIAKVIKEAA